MPSVTYEQDTFGLLSSKLLRSSTNSLFFYGPSKLRQTFFIEMRIYSSFGLILRDIPNSITPLNHAPPATDPGRTACTPLYLPVQAVPSYSLTPFPPVPDRGTGEGRYLYP